MGIYFRKSIRVGPLRFNLSGSGIGVSTGIRGFRVGFGPRGHYVNMGAGGVYYRATIPINENANAAPPQSTPTSSTHAPLRELESGCPSRMVDSSSASLLQELNKKQQRLSLWPFAAGLCAIVGLFLLASGLPVWITLPLIVIGGVGVVVVVQYDALTKSVVMFYSLTPGTESAFEQVRDALIRLRNCGGIWRIDARGDVYDARYHAGAGYLIRRTAVRIFEGQPSYVKANIDVPCLPVGPNKLYFFPDRILVFGQGQVGAISYRDLSIVATDKRFIEDGYVPHDTRVVGQTWQYVNKNGGPDRRFKNNRQLPICLYEELWLNSPTGLSEIVQLSCLGLSEELNNSIGRLAEETAKPPKMEDQPNRGGLDDSSTEFESTGHMQFVAVLEMLGCLMVADGRASTAERAAIKDLLRNVKCPWDDGETDRRLSHFVTRVQENGYRSVLASALQDVRGMSSEADKAVLLQCLETVSLADGKVTDREKQLINRIRATLN